ncbi:MAG: OsmC family protein [Anaerolineaceae bacterium]
MDAKVTWKSGLAFTGISDSGFAVPIDTSVEHGGSGEGVSPMEMLLIGLGGCSGMDVVSILAKKRQVVTQFEILLHGDRATDHPKVFTNITVEYVVTGHDLDPESVKRAVELSETKYCSVMATLRKTAEIKVVITIKDGD